MPQYAAPGMFEHRLSDVIQPLIANFRRDGRRTAPDFVEVSSGTWDLARWAEQDMEVAKDTEVGLTQDRVTWYRFRVGQMLEKVRSAFPNAASKTWRTLHYPADQAAEHDYFMVRLPLSTCARADFFAGQDRTAVQSGPCRARRTPASLCAQPDLPARPSSAVPHRALDRREGRLPCTSLGLPHQRVGADPQGPRGTPKGPTARAGATGLVHLGRQYVLRFLCSRDRR